MSDLWASVEFWMAMLAASLIKLRASHKLTFWGSVLTIVTAVAAALVFTVPLINYLELTGDVYRNAVAALVALSAEHVARQVMDVKLSDIIRLWRGKGE